MNGTIHFDDAAALATFLKEFSPCSATFKVMQNGDGFDLTFTGGF